MCSLNLLDFNSESHADTLVVTAVDSRGVTLRQDVYPLLHIGVSPSRTIPYVLEGSIQYFVNSNPSPFSNASVYANGKQYRQDPGPCTPKEAPCSCR